MYHIYNPMIQVCTRDDDDDVKYDVKYDVIFPELNKWKRRKIHFAVGGLESTEILF